MKVLDHPRSRTHSLVMMATDWRAERTMASVTKHSQTTIQGLMRDFAVMDSVEHGPGAVG
jgi:hypothetical protein